MREATIRLEASPTAAHVGLVVATYANDAGECWPSLSTIAVASRRSERRVREALVELTGLGLIERRGRGPGRSALTRILDLTGDPPPPMTGGPPPPNGHDRRPVARDDRRPVAPMTGGPPPPEHPEEHPEQLPPQPPKGGRSRDHRGFKEDFAAWAEENFPGIDVGCVRHAVGWARPRPGDEPDMDEVRRFIEKWAPRQGDHDGGVAA